MDFDEAITAGEYLIIECYRKLDQIHILTFIMICT